jgi:hypothetical protein
MFGGDGRARVSMREFDRLNQAPTVGDERRVREQSEKALHSADFVELGENFLAKFFKISSNGRGKFDVRQLGFGFWRKRRWGKVFRFF